MANRREFLKKSCTLSGTLWVSSTAIAALAPTTSWAIELTHFSETQSRLLITLIRHIFPHDKLDDAVYALVIKELDGAAASDPDVAALLTQGIADLNERAAGDWLTASAEEQLGHLEAIADGAFFTHLRQTSVVSLYNNELAFAHFGYEGASYAKGGYLNRGFNDLDWLPNPPADASPRT